MRLIRIVTLERRAPDASVTALIDRLLQGLPENTYGRAEEYFSKRSENARKTEELKEQQRKLDMIQAEKRKREETEYRYQQEKRRISTEASKNARVKPWTSEASASKARKPVAPLRSIAASQSSAPAVSPSTLEAAAALIQQRPAEPNTQAAPPGVAGASDKSDRQDGTITVTSSTSGSHSSASSGVSVAHDASRRARKFPFRDAPASSHASKDRIIDRRRARNELLRKRYLAAKAQKAKAVEGETSASASQPAAEWSQPTASTDTPGSAPVFPPTAAVQMTVGRAASISIPPPKKSAFAVAEVQVAKPIARRGSA